MGIRDHLGSDETRELVYLDKLDQFLFFSLLFFCKQVAVSWERSLFFFTQTSFLVTSLHCAE